MSGGHQIAYSTLKSCRHEVMLLFRESWRSPTFLPFDGFELFSRTEPLSWHPQLSGGRPVAPSFGKIITSGLIIESSKRWVMSRVPDHTNT